MEICYAMDKIRVIFVKTYPKSGDGIAHYSRYLLRELSRMAHIHLICFFWRANNKIFNEIRAFSSLIAHYLAIKKINPDVIHIQFTTELYPKFFFLIFCDFLVFFDSSYHNAPIFKKSKKKYLNITYFIIINIIKLDN